MKKMLLLMLLFGLKNQVKSQDTRFPDNTNIYLVRHAEKETGNDPALTEAGKKRAGDLMRILKDKQVQRIYVTGYHRSEMTADSMRIQLGVDTVHYVADTTGDGFMKAFKKNNDAGKTILIIGHSNTILRLLMAFGIQNQAHDIPDNEFDNLYLVKFKGEKASVEFSKYGSRSGNSAPMKPVQ